MYPQITVMELFENTKVQAIAEIIGESQMMVVMNKIKKNLDELGISEKPIDIWYSDTPPLVSYSYVVGGETKVTGFAVHSI